MAKQTVETVDTAPVADAAPAKRGRGRPPGVKNGDGATKTPSEPKRVYAGPVSEDLHPENTQATSRAFICFGNGLLDAGSFYLGRRSAQSMLGRHYMGERVSVRSTPHSAEALAELVHRYGNRGFTTMGIVGDAAPGPMAFAVGNSVFYGTVVANTTTKPINVDVFVTLSDASEEFPVVLGNPDSGEGTPRAPSASNPLGLRGRAVIKIRSQIWELMQGLTGNDVPTAADVNALAVRVCNPLHAGITADQIVALLSLGDPTAAAAAAEAGGDSAAADSESDEVETEEEAEEQEEEEEEEA